MVDLKKYATDFIFMRKARFFAVESISTNYTIIESGNHDQQRMVKMNFLKRKKENPEMVGSNKFQRRTENMASISTEIMNEVTDSTKPIQVKGA